MQPFEILEYGQFYHIYNHGVGGRNLFLEPGNYEYFLGCTTNTYRPLPKRMRGV
jgi:hypothetical protein